MSRLLGLLTLMFIQAHPADRLVCTRPLGAIYTPGGTVFRVWAPTASAVTLNLYRDAVKPDGQHLAMTHRADGSWDATVTADCLNWYYTYSAAGPDPGFRPQEEVVDPYARACTTWDGRGIVVDDRTLGSPPSRPGGRGSDRTSVAPRPSFPPQDAVIYEMHVRDFTIDPASGVQQKGLYGGLVEAGTRCGDQRTGLDHLLELGVNTVQLMPVQQFCHHGGYGWGYDAALYNCPDTSYAANHAVQALKHAISEFHQHGIRVVMDVVYTHTAQEVYDRQGAFERLVPGYYFRHKADGTLYNGSGCGNEFRSEAPMARRFVLDSLRHWVLDYGVDGFRFDLMGLLDMDTCRQLARELHAIDPNLLIYGEPWAAGDTPIVGMGRGRQKGLGISIFNDHMRDALRGDVFHPDQPGFLETGVAADQVRLGIMGSIDDFTESPLESINYIECHDNRTLWDRLLRTAPQASEAERVAMDKLGAAVLLTSQGIPFLQSGQDFLRAKGGDDNSYNKGDDVNMVRWGDKATHRDVFDWYRALLALRRQHPMFRLVTAAQVRRAIHWLPTPDRVIAYRLDDVTGTDPWRQAILVFNGSVETRQVQVPAGLWVMALKSGEGGLDGTTVTVAPHGVAILRPAGS